MFFLPSTNLDETNPFFCFVFSLNVHIRSFFTSSGFCNSVSNFFIYLFFNELGVYRLCELWVLSVDRFSGPLSSPTIKLSNARENHFHNTVSAFT